MAPASPRRDKEPEARAPTISATTNIKKLNADTVRIKLLSTWYPKRITSL
jgi:hypothetical protein